MHDYADGYFSARDGSGLGYHKHLKFNDASEVSKPHQVQKMGVITQTQIYTRVWLG